MASSMLSNLVTHSSKYDSIRINTNEWLVRKTYIPPPSRKGYIPDFDVIQTVTAIDTPNREVKQLQCTCQYSEIYGMPCIHSIVVATSFRPHWTYVTHNDVSVRWWKAYYLFSLPETIIPDKVKQQQIKQVFKTLRNNETVGIHVNVSMFINQEIHEGPIPAEYELTPHVVRCTNYPDSNKVTDFDPFNSNLDGTMSQVTDINTQLSDEGNENEDEVFAFVTENVNKSIQKDKKTKSFYSQLKPNFSEAVNWINNQEEADHLAQTLDNFVSYIKNKNKHTICNSTHTYVLSNLPGEKSRKHHGCESWKSKNRKK